MSRSTAAPPPVAGRAPPEERAWCLEVGAVASALGVDPRVGLTPAEAAGRLAAGGANQLVEQRRRSGWTLFASQFANTMVAVLGVALVVTVAIGERTDAIVIGVIVVLNAVVGFVQEHKAEQAMAALRRLAAETATVRRGGSTATFPGADLVVGDVVLLAAGDLVAADLRLAEVWGLRVNEATLTGEAEPVAKVHDPLSGLDDGLVADRINMAFKGTAVTYGRAEGIVVATGMDTELGHIAGLLQAHAAGTTPLQRHLAELGRVLATASIVVCVLVFVAGLLAGEGLHDMFLTSVSLAVAAIPEGLPAVVTVSLALGARRMAERRAVIRKLPAVEALGSVTVICSDKTGTLTENQMLVERVWTPEAEYSVGGRGYAPEGEIRPASAAERDGDLTSLAAIASACNDAHLRAPDRAGGEWSVVGDPTEGALAAFAGKAGAAACPWPRVAEIGFDAGRRRMVTVHRRDGRIWVATKGALDVLDGLLDPAGAAAAGEAQRVAERWTSGGYRVLALAERWLDRLPDHLDDVERGLRLVGLVALSDPPREAAAPAVAACRTAGIVPVMITGDDPRTAGAIARRLGIIDGDGRILTGGELDGLDDAAFASIVEDVAVYARTSPEQKLRIVEAWKQRGAVVAMTGDGVNDAPALRRADVGVAMGVMGTEVSKEAADIVLADDNFATIVTAVGEGRRIYDNLRRFVLYMVTTNFGEVLIMLVALIAGLPLPLLPVQILWVNLVTDGLPAVALGLEPPEPDVMRRAPRPPQEAVISGGLWSRALGVGALMAAIALTLMVGARSAGWEWQTMVFTAVVCLELGRALAVRSERVSFWALGPTTNPWLLGAVGASVLLQLAVVYLPPLQTLFHTAALSPAELAVTLACSTILFMAVESEKWWRRRQAPDGHRWSVRG